MSTVPRPAPQQYWRAGLFLYLLVPVACFLLGILFARQFLYIPNNPPSQGKPHAENGPAVVDLPQPEEGHGELFRFDTDAVSRAAATLAGAGGDDGRSALTELTLLKAGEVAGLWKLQEMVQAPPLRPEYLSQVRDSTPIAMLPSFRDKEKQGQVPDLAHFNDLEAEAFCEALWKANLTSTSAFANSARTELTFSDLFNEPHRYRGQVVHFEGRLRRVRHSKAPIMARSRGVEHLYEGWLFDPQRYGTNPVCLVFTELPTGLSVAEQMDQPVTFDAYFFKKYRYQSADSKPGYAREAPLFIGRSPVPVKGPPSAPQVAWSTPLLVGFLGLLLLTVVIAFGLHWWFRRGDRRVHDRLAVVREREFVEPGPPGFPDTTPSAN